MYHWEVVESLFEEYPLVKQHIDSYNEFIDRKVDQILQEENEVTTTKNEGTKIKFHTIRIEKPTITEADGSKRLIYPMEARMRKSTYAASLFLDMSLLDDGKEIDRDEVYVGELPVMVRSKLCNLNGMAKEALVKVDEDQYEQGGYFIVSGNEKVLVSQEELAPNRVMINKETKTGKITTTAKITSSKGRFRGKIALERTPEGLMYLQFPGTPKNLNMLVVLRALGIGTQKEVLEAFSDKTDTVNDILLNLEAVPLKNSKEAIDYLGKRIAAGQLEEYRLSRAQQAIDNYLFPHIGTSPEDRLSKAYYLASVAERVMDVSHGLREEDDKDHYMNKRIKISGALMEDLFRYALQSFTKDLGYQMDRAFSRGRKLQIRTLVRPDALSDRLGFAMRTGNWIQKQGVAQLLDRLTYMSTVSHLRRVNSPLSKSQHHFDARELHPTHFGKICPNETPEGSPVGLVKNIAIGCFISTKNHAGIENQLSDLGLEVIKKGK